MTPSRLASTLASLVLLAATALGAPLDVTLQVGDKAPALENVDWLQGEAVRSFEEGQVYVLDFWATWCGPCIASIPHINELATTRKDDGVTVIGVAIWPRSRMTPTQEFVDDQGEKMSYTIAADIDGKTAEAYMTASGQNGIPTAMVVDQQGTLVWIGHPVDGLDRVVDEVVAGTFDLEAEAERRAAEKAEEEAWMAVLEEATPINEALQAALEAEEWQVVHDRAEEMAALHERFAGYHNLRYRALLRLDETGVRGATLGRELVTTTFAEDSRQLEGFAWWIVAPDSDVPADMRDLDLALDAALRADDLTGNENASIQDTLARIRFRQGDVPAAIALQKKAIALAEKAEDESLASMIETFRTNLAEYEAAAEG